MILRRDFYARPTLEVARDLLGCELEVVEGKSSARVRIVETEAYFGTDPAAHSARVTARSAVMFEDPGHVYVYFTYGMHEMLNFVTEARGHAGAVLIRGVEIVDGDAASAAFVARRRIGVAERNWLNGPARLCKALGVRLSDNRASLVGKRLRVHAGAPPKGSHILRSPRIGISKGAEKEWRFFLADADGKIRPGVSPVPENKRARPIAAREWKRELKREMAEFRRTDEVFWKGGNEA